MKYVLKLTLVGVVLAYLGFAVWMNTVAFVEVSCPGVVFSFSWPIFALAMHVPIVEAIPGYEWIELHVAGACL